MKNAYKKITQEYKFLMRRKSKKEIIVYLTFSTFSLAGFAVVTFFVRADILREFDFNSTVRLQDKIPLVYDDFFSILSIIGRFEYTFALLLLLLLLNKKVLGFVWTVGLFGFAHVVEIIGKTMLNQPGPPHMFLRTHFTDFPGLYVHTQASYPSGHSLRIIFLTILVAYLVLITKKLPNFVKIGVLFFTTAFTTIMLISRVSLGEHWTTDVIGGSLLGAGTAFLSLVFL